MDKREQNLKQREALYYRPQKTQKRIVSSKQLLATQSVLKQENSQESISTSTPPPNKPKPKGFKTMKVKQKVRTSSPRVSKQDNNEEDNMGIDDIEKYISQQYHQQQQQETETSPPPTTTITTQPTTTTQSTDNLLNKSLNSSIPFCSDNSPDPGTPIDFVAEHDSSPEPQRNSSFHVLKKQKPKKKRKKRKDRDKDKDKEDNKDKKDRKDRKKKDKKKKKKKDKQRNAISMEPEDCTIRYDNDQNTYSAKIATAFSSGAAMIRNKYNEKTTTNPFDSLNENNSTSTNPFDHIDKESNTDNKNVDTNPFGSNTNVSNTTKQKSTNPFFADGDLP